MTKFSEGRFPNRLKHGRLARNSYIKIGVAISRSPYHSRVLPAPGDRCSDNTIIQLEINLENHYKDLNFRLEMHPVPPFILHPDL